MILQNHSTPGKFSTYLALTSFAIGTLLLLIHLAFSDQIGIMVMGLFYVLLATLLNSIALIYLLSLLIPYWHDRETIAIRILILLANIPVTILYVNIALSNKLF